MMMTTTKGARAMKKAKKAVPFHGAESCYACDAEPVGFRDRTPEGGYMEYACKRHADPTIRVYHACIYCNGPVRTGALVIQWDFAHKSCHRDAANGGAYDRYTR